jgi:hypothetical protein
MPFYGEEIVTFPNPLLHAPSTNGLTVATNPLSHIPPNGHNPHNAGWRCVAFNPMAMGIDPFVQHHCPPWDLEPHSLNNGVKEISRSKITVPKPVIVEVSEESEMSSDMDESLLDPPEEEVHEVTTRVESRAVARQVSRPRPHGRKNGVIRDPRAFVEDYRRFSGRSRKKTDFFGVRGRGTGNQEAEQKQAGQKRGRGQGDKAGRVRDLDSKLHLLDEKLAGSVGSAEEVAAEAGKEESGKEESPQATAVRSYL